MSITIAIVTVFEQLYTPFLQTSLVHRASENKLVSIQVDTLFSYVQPKERIDAPVCGHNAGMLIRPEVVERAVDAHESKHGPAFKIFFSPQGRKLDQAVLTELAQIMQTRKHIMLLPARYEGMDARVEQEYADMTISVGDFVLMGGDIPAMMLLEGVLRLIPGVIGRQESVVADSFTDAFVDHPSYTLPVVWKGHMIPEVVRSGNHKAITTWQDEQAARTTVLHHFGWLRSHTLSGEDKQRAYAHIPSHYIALLHSDVLIGSEKIPGVTSVTSLDIHDIARSAYGYGLKNYFIVTPLIDQQKIVQTLLDFWQGSLGSDYNKNRHNAVNIVSLQDTLDAAIAAIASQEGKMPLLVATSARRDLGKELITFYDQERVWREQRPVLFVLGTGKGLAQEVIDRSDFLLTPIEGFTNFNHLSVRSAAAVIFDRWLGIQPK